LHVALEEALLAIVEQTVAVEPVGERREAAARHAGDDVDLIEEAEARTLRADRLGALQDLGHAAGKRGCACASAGEGQDEERSRIVALDRAVRETAARVGGALRSPAG